MRIQILSIIFIFCFCITLFGQKDISGTYYNEYGVSIRIDNNKFTYIFPQTHSPIYSSDTLAECTIERVDNNFIEINSISPLLSLLNGLEMNQKYDKTINDSIKVVFKIPYNLNSLTISIATDLAFQKLFEFDYSKSHNSIMLPKTTTFFLIGFTPQLSSIRTHYSDGLSYGIVKIEPLLSCTVEDGKNIIAIDIPTLVDSFFEKYYIKGEYARISNKMIKWRGELYIKK